MKKSVFVLLFTILNGITFAQSFTMKDKKVVEAENSTVKKQNKINSTVNAEETDILLRNDDTILNEGKYVELSVNMDYQTNEKTISDLITPESTSANNSRSHYIGETYGGGKVFYIYDNGLHGLIAPSSSDQGSNVQWGLTNNTGTTGTGIGSGFMNTSLIISVLLAKGQTTNFAAKVCADYSATVGGVMYGDWYLPSKEELYNLYLKRSYFSGLVHGYYWTSTENDSSKAWTMPSMTNSGTNPTSMSKSSNYRLRCIRAF